MYQVITIEDQLDEVTRAVDQMDSRVKHAEYEKAKFFSIAKDILRLAPKDPNAEQIVVDLKLRKLQAAQPVLMALSAPSMAPTLATTNAAPARANAATNSAPAQPSQATNAAPVSSASPVATP